MASNPRWSYTGSSSGVLYTDRRDFYLQPQRVAQLWGMLTPFWSFTAKLSAGDAEVYDPDFKMFQYESKLIDDLKFYQNAGTDRTFTDGTETAAITIDYADAGSANVVGVRAGTLVEVRSSANVWKCTAIVTTYSSATSIEITPLYTATSGTTAGADNDIYYIIGSAEAEGDVSPTAWSDELEVVWGACQIMKTPLELTGTLLKMTRLRGESSELARLRGDKYDEHNIGKNRSFLFGVRYPALTAAPTTYVADGTNSRIIRTTWGIVTILRRHGTSGTNYLSRTYGAYSWDDFVDDMKLAFKYKNLQGIKYAFCGAGVMGFFSKKDTGIMGNSSFVYNIDANSVQTRFGFDINQIKTPFGTLNLVYEPLLRGQYDNTMVIVDPENVKRVVFRSPMYQTAIQANDADLHKDQYFSDEGLGVTNIKSHTLVEFA